MESAFVENEMKIQQSLWWKKMGMQSIPGWAAAGLQKIHKAWNAKKMCFDKTWLNLKTLIFYYGNGIVFGTVSEPSHSMHRREECFITMPISDHTPVAKSILFDMWHVAPVCE